MTSPSRSKRRPTHKLSAAAAAILLCGCSSENGMDFSDVWQIAKMSVGSDDQNVTLQQAAAIPYASISVSLGKNPQQILVLASNNGQQQLWTSASRIAVMIQNGRVIRTSGLPQNLSGFTPHDIMRVPAAGSSVSYIADFADIGAYSVEISCRTSSSTTQSIVVLDSNIQADRIEEECVAPKIDWTFTNIYWIDPAGITIWRSIQYFHPKSDPLEIETLRPVAG